MGALLGYIQWAIAPTGNGAQRCNAWYTACVVLLRELEVEWREYVIWEQKKKKQFRETKQEGAVGRVDFEKHFWKRIGNTW